MLPFRKRSECSKLRYEGHQRQAIVQDARIAGVAVEADQRKPPHICPGGNICPNLRPGPWRQGPEARPSEPPDEVGRYRRFRAVAYRRMNTLRQSRRRRSPKESGSAPSSMKASCPVNIWSSSQSSVRGSSVTSRSSASASERTAESSPPSSTSPEVSDPRRTDDGSRCHIARVHGACRSCSCRSCSSRAAIFPLSRNF